MIDFYFYFFVLDGAPGLPGRGGMFLYVLSTIFWSLIFFIGEKGEPGLPGPGFAGKMNFI
jgi:hypothetical protein